MSAGLDAGALARRWRDLTAVEGDIAIHRVLPVTPPLDALRAFAVRAGLPESPEWTEIGPLLELDDGDRMVTVYQPSGGYRWIDHTRWQVDDGADLEIGDDEAAEAAAAVVERLDPPGEGAFALRRVTRLRVASGAKQGEPTRPRVIDVGVVFGRVLDGLPVEGQGGAMVVYLDAALRPTGLDRVARPLARHEPVRDWRSLDDVLSATEARWRPGFGVRELGLTFVELGRLEEQTYVQPCFRLSLDLPTEDGVVRTVDHYEPAATNSTGPVMPEPTDPPAARRQ